MKLTGLRKTYGGRSVLDIESLELEPGMIYAVVGANGSGKSTLARIMAGTVEPDDPAAACRATGAGYMPQKSYAFHLSTLDNIMLGSGDGKAALARARALMETLGLSGLAAQRANRLSGGETARMALARVLLGEHALLILDEPTAAMDMESTASAEGLIKRYRDEHGAAVLLVTHSIAQARRVADEVLFLHEGRLVERGQAGALLCRPENALTRRFIEFYGS